MVQTRRRFEGLRLGTADEINQAMNVRYLGNGVIEATISKNGTDREELVLVFNSGPDQGYQLPSGQWTMAVEGGVSTRDRQVSGNVRIAGTAVTVLYRK